MTHLRSDLVPALTCLQMNNFPHVGSSFEGCLNVGVESVLKRSEGVARVTETQLWRTPVVPIDLYTCNSLLSHDTTILYYCMILLYNNAL